MAGALDGIRVLDLSRLAPGPYCSMLLADMGADVLLVEPVPKSGEPPDERSAAYFALGRNKRSICLDLKQPEGVAIFRALARRADVLLEGFRPGVMARLGLDHTALAAENQRLVYCSLSGFGQTGPYAQMAGHDLDYLAIGGALGMIGRPGTPPAIPMNLIADYAAGGLMAAFAIVAALLAREKSGFGQHIDVAMSDGVLSLLTKLAGQYFERGTVPQPGAHRINGANPDYDVYLCSDGGYLAVGPLEPHLFQNLCRALDLPELASAQSDSARSAEIRAAFERRFREHPRDEWFQRLREADACAAPVYRLDEALDDPHHLAREMVTSFQHPRLGEIRQIGVAPKLSLTPGKIRSVAPVAGAHTDAVLAEIGFGTEEIAALRAAAVIR
jgi:crotonobetainyl-CoA:carnitine CoA-transferase CaiB-like acyl-CoA transferase